MSRPRVWFLAECHASWHEVQGKGQEWHEKIYSLPLLNRWDIQPISGALRTSNRDPQRQSQGIKGRQHALHLGQVRSMILARTKLKRAVWTGVNRATDRGTIHPHPTWVQIVHADQLLTQLSLEDWSLPLETQVIQHRRQPIITAVQAQTLPVPIRADPAAEPPACVPVALTASAHRHFVPSSAVQFRPCRSCSLNLAHRPGR